MMTKEDLAQEIALEMERQGVELDNLGDSESVVFMGNTPVLNLVELAEAILAALKPE